MIDISEATVPSIAWLIVPVAALLSGLVVRLGIVYARARGLMDQPGRRRSHTIATPRGGGVGIVVALLAGIGCMLIWRPVLIDAALAATLLIGTAIVAAVGWYDDHRPLGVVVRLVAHALSAGLLSIVVLRGDMQLVWTATLIILPFICWLAATLTIVASINFHNFMDGIDGLLALQALFVFVASAVCGWLSDAMAYALLCAIAAATVAGFVPFNMPQAKVFMGDVGSGVLGLLIAALLLIGLLHGILSPLTALLLPSAFVIDAGATLVSRMVRGRRWYSAHREHLYQWLVRGGRSHAAVTGLYMAWNILVVVPAVVIGASVRLPVRCVLGIAVYACGTLLWCAMRRRCLTTTRVRGEQRASA